MSNALQAYGQAERFLAGFGARDPEINASYELPDEAWHAALATASHHRLTGLAVAALEAGHLPLSREASAELFRRHEAAMVHALNIERHLIQLAEAFRTAGVEPIVLKGSGLAHTFYPDPSWRPFGDLDLLVRTEDWSRSCELLAELGHRRRYVEPRAGFDKRFGRTALHISPTGLEVDLHRGLASGPFTFWVPGDELFQGPASFELAGLTLSRLNDTTAFLHACMHASLGSRPAMLMPLRDVAQVAASGRVDWDQVRTLALSWRLRAVVLHALQTASAVLDIKLPPEARELTDSLTPEKREWEALNAFTSDRRYRAGRAIVALRAVPGLRAKGAYAWALLVPDRDFMASQSGRGGQPSYVRRWMTPMRRRARKARATVTNGRDRHLKPGH
jgi:Uncharacterised nucleotidyltransferase